MPGERDLRRLLESLDVSRRPGTFAFVVGDRPGLADAALATIREDEGTTLVVPADVARRAGAPVDFEAAWLTITVWSSLAAVGLTAAMSTVLADAGIACNVLAGYHHDHLLVPAARADEAVTLLRGLATA